ncbi:MAG TPA: hypothetical protein VFQ68_21260 [Streptosporangiaceae bacterium]|nr:hypothetical protein [Streptosporangiaceae bacterium]
MPASEVKPDHGRGDDDARAGVQVRQGMLEPFGLQEALSSQGAWYLVIVGGLAAIATLVASRGRWGLASDRFGWSLLPVGYRARHPRG